MRVLERTDNHILVSMPPRKWNHLMELEHAYKTARTILKARSQCDAAPTLTINEAYDMIDQL